MIAPDTSVLAAGADPRHSFPEGVTDALGEVRDHGSLVAHIVAEAYAVLTGAAYARSGRRVGEYLSQFLATAPIGVAPDDYPQALGRLTAAGLEGGALYDGLIALGAQSGGATLVSLDRRSARTYELCGADYRLLMHES